MSAPLDKLFVREFERSDDKILRISQSEIGDVGCVVWDAAIVLASYLETADFRDSSGEILLKGTRILELGSGTGIVGIQAGCQGAQSVITDLPDFVPLMTLNIEENTDHIQNAQGKVEAKELSWGEDVQSFLPSPDYVLLADCIYYEQSLEPLVKTIDDLTGACTTVFCCYEERTTGNKPELERRFLELIKKKFHITKVPLDRQHPVYRSDDIHILKFTKR